MAKKAKAPKAPQKKPDEPEVETPPAAAPETDVHFIAITAARDPYRRAGLSLGKNPLVVAVAALSQEQFKALDADPNVFIQDHEVPSSSSEAIGQAKTSSSSEAVGQAKTSSSSEAVGH